ncbi:H-2 class II histocompatibility antigen, E-S beta chain-like isoform X1 [Periophthalmus magnuspinnatus]|uniref:H-2 class II histocompatibility antigen, E-S beta chain-like isoform X2 n=1 Tax=Periophthalmus magnuspinnatus TaxID=409849 RepID=UPI00145C18CC|nr:H-2 class II histocompatibility antigen, E-S beta chain-like isoform X2 [Periophthalmus magnuspinnatus]XP_033839716.1 H-2 class II histocompatibility antigen, E-S beta chain-like isoform X1 [Periophthalmus magnuspinnatus]
MRRTCVCVCALLLLGLQTADGYLHVVTHSCEFNSTDPKDIQYIYSHFYHKLEYIRFDSRVGKFVGYTEYGVKNAERWNKDPATLERRRHEKDRLCVNNINIWNDAILSKSVEPYAVLNSAPSAGSDRVLVCSVYGFYPKDVTVSWTNHHQPLTIGVTSTDLMPHADWYYQLHSQLEYSPRSGDQISCVVEHISLKEPLVLDWEDAVSDGDRNKFAIGASGLVLGLVLSLAGFIFYKHKSRGWVMVSRGS